MAINTRTRIMIWGAAGSVCAKPGCGKILITESEAGNRSLVGEVAHIISPKPDGPRHDLQFPKENFDSYENLLLLCQEHHKLVDDHPTEYVATELRRWKEEHERSAARQQTESQKRELEAKLRYGQYLDSWIEQSDINNWKEWTSDIFGNDQPRMSTQKFDQLSALNTWLLSRVWPEDLFKDLRDEFTNFRLILNDFLLTFRKHAEPEGDMLWTRKFYQISDYNPEKYQSLFRQWLFHSKLVQDLCLELTRSGNRVCELARLNVQSDFRAHEGVLLIISGPNMKLQYITYRTEYRAGEKFGGLKQFIKERESRDTCFGCGEGPEDPRFKNAFDC